MATVEGANGVGKTSLINVAAFKCYQNFLTKGTGSLLIPCRRAFQLRPEQDVNQFVNDVLLEVAQTLISGSNDLLAHKGALPNVDAINEWLNAPQLDRWQGGVGSVGLAKTSEANTSAGFEISGFRKEILSWLEHMFPDGQGGGVLCIIDNMELLQTSSSARFLVEQLRDSLLLVPGLRWVLCGANGIINSVASSPRLDGILHSPIELTGVPEDLAPDILDSRIQAYSIDPFQSYLPLCQKDFEVLYDVLARNLRNLLKRADSYCMAVSDGPLPRDDVSKEATFKNWLEQESYDALVAAKSQLRPRAWEVFETALEIGGRFSPSDYEKVWMH